jgi:hypothetical protein
MKNKKKLKDGLIAHANTVGNSKEGFLLNLYERNDTDTDYTDLINYINKAFDTNFDELCDLYDELLDKGAFKELDEEQAAWDDLDVARYEHWKADEKCKEKLKVYKEKYEEMKKYNK